LVSGHQARKGHLKLIELCLGIHILLTLWKEGLPKALNSKYLKKVLSKYMEGSLTSIRQERRGKGESALRIIYPNNSKAGGGGACVCTRIQPLNQDRPG
jgi:hypothetical protein